MEKNFLVLDPDCGFIGYSDTKENGLELAKKDVMAARVEHLDYTLAQYQVLTLEEYNELYEEDNTKADREDINH